MVIQCSACDTRFKIADDKVKPGGVKVRCSKCKEVFTVLPPEDETAATATEPGIDEPAAAQPSSEDWGALSSSFETTPEAGSGLNDVDWDSLNGDESAPEAAESIAASAAVANTDFSFGDDDESDAESDNFSFDEAEEKSSAVSTDDFSFGDDDEALADSDDSSEAFSFGGDADSADESFGFDEPLGEGAQDEFSFDDSPAAAADADADDFDWDGGSSTTADAAGGDFGFNSGEKTADSLDFSSLEMSDEKESVADVELPQGESTPARGEARPALVKGPQRGGAKARGARAGRTARKKGGPLRGILTLLILLTLILGGGLYGLLQMGYWSGNFEELPNVDYAAAGQTAWNKAVLQFDKLIGNETVQQPAGSITVTEMSGKYVENSSAGTLFVIEGTVRNDFTASRSAIAVRGTLYDTAGAPVQQQKVYCGNTLDSNALRTDAIATLQARGKNEFGDSLSNLDVAPGARLPFVIVFDNLPKNLSEYNVEVIGSAAGSKP